MRTERLLGLSTRFGSIPLLKRLDETRGPRLCSRPVGPTYGPLPQDNLLSFRSPFATIAAFSSLSLESLFGLRKLAAAMSTPIIPNGFLLAVRTDDGLEFLRHDAINPPEKLTESL